MRHCFALDLKNNEALIADYKKHHQEVWPVILEGIKSVGILDMEIYLTGNRMFMIMETTSTFNMVTDMKRLAQLPRQKEWEDLMWQFQNPLPHAPTGEKWMAMERIFKL